MPIYSKNREQRTEQSLLLLVALGFSFLCVPIAKGALLGFDPSSLVQECVRPNHGSLLVCERFLIVIVIVVIVAVP